MSSFNQEVWEDLFNLIPTTVEYKESWANGTGYFDNACDEQIDEVCKFTDKDGRKGILIPYDGHTICVFERFAPGGCDAFVLVSNTPLEQRSPRLSPYKSTDDIIQRSVIMAFFDGNMSKNVVALKSFIQSMMEY